MNLTPLYDVKLISKDKQHFYQLGSDETYYPGVTTVLKVVDKPALIPWALNSMESHAYELITKKSLESFAGTGEFRINLSDLELKAILKESKNIYKKKAEEAADIGSRVHQAIDALIKGEKLSHISDDMKPAIDGFLDWKSSHSLKIEAGDTKLGSKMFGYGGSLDFVAFEGSEAIIFDIKTTKKRKDRDHGIYPEYAKQLSAYARAFTETYGIPVKEVWALWLNKEKAGFKPLKVSNINLCFENFLACLKIYNSQKFEMFDENPLI